MDLYDKAKIGKAISLAGDHEVYEYGDSEVIKFSKFDRLMGYKLALKKSLYEIEICEKYFGDYFLPTQVLHASSGSHVALVQPNVVGHGLVKADLQDAHITSQFHEILERHAQLVADGHAPIDLLGGKGVFSSGLSNIYVTEEKQLKIIDATSLEVSHFPILARIVCWPLFTIGQLLQNSRIASLTK